MTTNTFGTIPFDSEIIGRAVLLKGDRVFIAGQIVDQQGCRGIIISRDLHGRDEKVYISHYNYSTFDDIIMDELNNDFVIVVEVIDNTTPDHNAIYRILTLFDDLTLTSISEKILPVHTGENSIEHLKSSDQIILRVSNNPGDFTDSVFTR